MSAVTVPETHYVSVGDMDVAYQVLGNGPIDLVYHHGFCHLELQWEVPQEAAWNRSLASFCRLILFDRRGTGASERTSRGFVPTWEEWSEDVRAVLDEVGSESAAIFTEAEAGPTAILFAAAHPERVRALVLGNPSARYRADVDYPQGWPQEAIDGLIANLEATWGSTATLLDAGFPALEHDETSLAAQTRLLRAAATPRMAAAVYRHVVENLDVRSVLPMVRAPTLVLMNESRVREQTRYVAEHIAGARLVEVPGYAYLFYGGEHRQVLEEVAEFLTGQPGQVEADRILTTVLFTDIVDSTARAAEAGDERWRNLLDSHDRIVRTQLRHFRGREINTTGDGFVAVFDGPARAVRCAQEVTRAAVDAGLPVRAGLHTGECEVRGRDIAGVAVHIASRVSALAAPSEVLVSRTVVDLVTGSGLRFDDRGEHQLKGVPGGWRVFAAVG